MQINIFFPLSPFTFHFPPFSFQNSHLDVVGNLHLALHQLVRRLNTSECVTLSTDMIQ